MGTHPIFESDFDCLTDSSDLSNYLLNSILLPSIQVLQLWFWEEFERNGKPNTSRRSSESSLLTKRSSSAMLTMSPPSNSSRFELVSEAREKSSWARTR